MNFRFTFNNREFNKYGGLANKTIIFKKYVQQDHEWIACIEGVIEISM